MEYVLNSREMKACDKNSIEYYGVPSMVLMERAACAVSDHIIKTFDREKDNILLLCGAGNNGGDGFAIARLLHLAGYAVDIVFPMNPGSMTEECMLQSSIAKKYNIPIYESIPSHTYTVIVDALFGIGLCRAIEGTLEQILTTCNQMNSYKIAVDIPSGISADTGEVLGVAFEADITISFGFAKIGQILYPGAKYCGKLEIADIGIDKHSLLDYVPKGSFLQDTDIQKLYPKRIRYSNKGSYGKVLVIAGSKDMAGAAYLAAKAAYYSGSGLVQVFTAEENRSVILTKLPEAIVTTYTERTLSVQKIKELLTWADSILIGPGIGTDSTARQLFEFVLKNRPESVPMVLDADALNLLSNNSGLMNCLTKECCITPHLGEMRRLTGKPIAEIQKNLILTATEYAAKYSCYCALKDARTIIAQSDGSYVINLSGNNGMATGGSGDVLAGLLAGMLAQGLEMSIAAPLACYIHGKAGDVAKEKKGAYSMLASDILEGISVVTAEIIQE